MHCMQRSMELSWRIGSLDMGHFPLLHCWELLYPPPPSPPPSLLYLHFHRHFFFFFSHFYFPASGQDVVTGVVPSSPGFLPSIFIAHRVQQSHCSSIFHRVLLTYALAFSASQFVHKKKVHTNLYEYALRGIRNHETDLYQVRG